MGWGGTALGGTGADFPFLLSLTSLFELFIHSETIPSNKIKKDKEKKKMVKKEKTNKKRTSDRTGDREENNKIVSGE